MKYALLALFALFASFAFFALPLPTLNGTETLSESKKTLYTLSDNNGRAVTEASFSNKIQLIFFGFTHCSNVCPTSLMTINKSLALLENQSKSKSKSIPMSMSKPPSKFQPIFISLDPARDTINKVDAYVDKFPGFIGLTGTYTQIQQAISNFRVFAVKEIGRTKDQYEISHTSLIYIVGENGQLCESISSAIAAADLSLQLQEVASEEHVCTKP